MTDDHEGDQDRGNRRDHRPDGGRHDRLRRRVDGQLMKRFALIAVGERQLRTRFDVADNPGARRDSGAIADLEASFQE